MRRGGSLRKGDLRRMGLDLMGDRGIRSLLVFHKLPVVDEREDEESCLERQDPRLLAVNFFFPQDVTPLPNFDRLDITPDVEKPYFFTTHWIPREATERELGRFTEFGFNIHDKFRKQCGSDFGTKITEQDETNQEIYVLRTNQ
jgi:hypothetical protein